MKTIGPEPPSYYTAEYLKRISSISLIIYTPFPQIFCPKSLKFPYSGSTVSLIYSNHAAINITLPENFGTSNAYTSMDLTRESNPSYIKLSIKSENEKVRIAPHEIGGRKTGPKFYEKSVDQPIPLNHTELSSIYNSGPISIQCINCGIDVIRPNLIMRWKALPSETWAEMMDFWHCHKPADDGKSSDLFNKSYAVSKFIPESTSVFVGLTYLLVCVSDLENIEIANLGKMNVTQYSSPNSVNCKSCNSQLGIQDTDTSIKLWKWSIKLSSQEKSVIRPYLYVSSQIAELISSHGVYCFSIHPEPMQSPSDNSSFNYTTNKWSSDPQILIWVFNSDIQYRSSGDISSRKGFKIFYSDDPKIIPKLEQERGDVEQIYLPQNVIDDLLCHLKQGNKILTMGITDIDLQDHQFNKSISKNWNLSILDKYQMLPGENKMQK